MLMSLFYLVPTLGFRSSQSHPVKMYVGCNIPGAGSLLPCLLQGLLVLLCSITGRPPRIPLVANFTDALAPGFDEQNQAHALKYADFFY